MNIWNMTKKDMAVIFKDRGAMLWIFVLPVVFTLIFTFLISMATSSTSGSSEEEDTRTPLAVVNLDPGGDLSERFIAEIDKAGGFRPEIMDQVTAEQNLKVLKISRYLLIPQNFSADLAQHKPVTVVMITHPSANAASTNNALQVANGVARDTSLELQLLDGIRQMGEMQSGNPLSDSVFNPERILAQAKGQFEDSRTRPLVALVEEMPKAVTGEERAGFDFTASVVPGLVVLFVFLSASVVARAIYEERKAGSLRRLLAAPLTRTELMLGKMTPIFLLTLVQIVVIFAVGAIILPLLGIGRLGIGEDPFAWAVASIVIALCSTCLGIMIAAIARTEAQISGLSNVLLWVAGFLGGALIPTFLIQQIPVLAVLSRLVPQSWATIAYNNILSRGASLADVLPNLGVLLIFSAVFFFIGVRRFKFE
jgi:ABC-2 type transport system permease protein